jgi:hypothetical protein
VWHRADLSTNQPVQAVCTRAQLLQLVVWPGTEAKIVDVVASGAGCWDVSVLSSGAGNQGVFLQIRQATDGSFAISAAAPAASASEVAIQISGLWLIGVACTQGAAGGTTVTVPVNSTGATTVVHCHR